MLHDGRAREKKMQSMGKLMVRIFLENEEYFKKENNEEANEEKKWK